ncbi:MAG: threonylcarbamoyl-AMP synthase [Tannerella sp.]|jgi:L-threonylcarbamoyladenylate synthase|nr:threonylcarbamoyl-AMP synthase [Tannerella sp.]
MESYRNDIIHASKILAAGGLILYPTDTIWGIGCDATNEAAVERIYALKKRRDGKAMIVLLDSTAKLDLYVREAPDVACDIAELSGTPVTIIYPEGKNLAANLLAEDKSIAIRITKEVFSKTLCETFRKPIVSTSANISGEPSPGSFSDIPDEIKRSVDYVVEYGQNDKTIRKASSIIRIGINNSVKIIRT